MGHRLIRLWDRSRVVTDWQCPRKRYWQYEYKGKGVVTAGTSLELFTGTVIHDCMAAIAKHYQDKAELDISTLARNSYNQLFDVLKPEDENDRDGFEFAVEQGTLIQGIILGFYKHAWPRIVAEYPEVIVYEGEMERRSAPTEDSRPQLVFMSKPDVLVRSAEGLTAYLEYKSTSSKKPEWINSWETAVQLHSTIKAVKETTGIDVDHVIVQGLYKGFESYGKQSSPFCYYYRRNGNPPFTANEISYEYKAGMRRHPVWELTGGVEGWVGSMPESILAEQFPRTPPIFFNEDLIEAFFRQREMREWDINLALESLETNDEDYKTFIMDKHFPQRFDQCTPAYGKGRACEYKALCHGRQDQDPLNLGLVWREPHHEQEAEQQREKEN